MLVALVPALTRRASPRDFACPRLLPHHRVVAEHLRYGRPFRQLGQFLCRPRLELPAVFYDGRTGSEASDVRSAHSAAAQSDRRENASDNFMTQINALPGEIRRADTSGSRKHDRLGLFPAISRALYQGPD